MPFSQSDADMACNFFEEVLKHTADSWYGKPFILSPWQEEAISEIFGRVDDEGNRVIETAYLEVPKKAGKSELVAGMVLLLLIMDKNPGCQVYGAAAATRQALNVYRAACKMVEQSPALKSMLRVMRGTNRILKRNDPDSFYAAVAADGDFGDGVNPSFVVADEVHRWKTRKQLENWDVLSNGGITRGQTLTIAITTAGVMNESPLAWRLHEKTRKIQEGIVADPKFFGRIYGAVKTDDPSDPATWIKANPSLKENGGFLDIEKIREKYESHLAEGDLTSFKRYFLNMWDQKEDHAIDMIQWDACPMDWTAKGLQPLAPEDVVRPLPSDLLGHFMERRCWVGIDLSMTTDMTAVSFVFPRDDDAGYDILPFFWMPANPPGGMPRKEAKDGVPYRAWAEQGLIELCEGGVVSYNDVRARLEWGSRMFDLQDMCFDPWNSRQLSTLLIEAGYTCIEVRQGYASLSEPSKKLLAVIASGTLHHGGHPVLRWNASCCAAKELNDNLMFSKPERTKSAARIDGIAASVNAIFCAIRCADSGPSMWASAETAVM